ncbi:unnamed protein product [Phytophthora fragariaefolia]|uniref:Unnamed protein product n=1 Tax=Phytophthora fragariaefolia TaxID=1490495 RepID=A0A9W6U1X9_9STRA|nr:unnamed protein product [Phytophthora fragariaefolia]
MSTSSSHHYNLQNVEHFTFTMEATRGVKWWQSAGLIESTMHYRAARKPCGYWFPAAPSTGAAAARTTTKMAKM